MLSFLGCQSTRPSHKVPKVSNRPSPHAGRGWPGWMEWKPCWTARRREPFRNKAQVRTNHFMRARRLTSDGYVYTYTYTRTHTHTHIYIYIYLHMLCMHTCVHTYMHTYRFSVMASSVPTVKSNLLTGLEADPNATDRLQQAPLHGAARRAAAPAAAAFWGWRFGFVWFLGFLSVFSGFYRLSQFQRASMVSGKP